MYIAEARYQSGELDINLLRVANEVHQTEALSLRGFECVARTLIALVHLAMIKVMIRRSPGSKLPGRAL